MDYKKAWGMVYNNVSCEVTLVFRNERIVVKKFASEAEANAFLERNVGNKVWNCYFEAYIEPTVASYQCHDRIQLPDIHPYPVYPRPKVQWRAYARYGSMTVECEHSSYFSALCWMISRLSDPEAGEVGVTKL